MDKVHVIKIQLSAAYKEGELLFDNTEIVTDTLIRYPLLKSEGIYKVVELRLAVPSVKAEALLNGLHSGVVSLYVEGMASEVDQAVSQ